MSEKSSESEGSGGQVSEASGMQNAGEIMPDQAVAGAPDAESGDVQEGKTGPNARTGTDEDDTSEVSGFDADDQSANRT